MPTVAANLKDVLDEFKFRIINLDPLVAAYCTVEMNPPKLHIWTLIAARHEPTEEQLARAERQVSQSFRQLEFDFTTVHLLGRDPIQFIPESAIPILLRDPAVLRHFQQAMVSGVNARAS